MGAWCDGWWSLWPSSGKALIPGGLKLAAPSEKKRDAVDWVLLKRESFVLFHSGA